VTVRHWPTFFRPCGGHRQNRPSDGVTGRPENYRLRHARCESSQESSEAILSNLHCGIQIRMVAGFAELIEREELLGAADLKSERQTAGP
jgi:hypothetical protein